MDDKNESQIKENKDTINEENKNEIKEEQNNNENNEIKPLELKIQKDEEIEYEDAITNTDFSN